MAARHTPVRAALGFFACLQIQAGAADNTPPPLSQAEMQPILRALQSDYADAGSVSFEALNRTVIDALLRAHPDTMQLVTVPDPAPPAPAPAMVSLTPAVACIRPFAMRREDAAAMRTFLTGPAAGDAKGLILDLRAPGSDADPAVVPEFAALFLPKGTPLFSLTSQESTASDPVWAKELIILTDADTGNAGEILTTVLRASNRALIAGSRTRGRTAAITEIPVRTGGGTRTLWRHTARRVTFGAGVPDPFGQGLTPDLPADLPPEAKAAVFALQAKDGLARGLAEPVRPRLNEAALTSGTNPELPERIARTARKNAPAEAPPVDRPLQAAVDVLTARAIVESPPPAPK